MNQFGISNQAKNILLEIFLDFEEIEQVYIYGSRAMGTYHKRSDVDLVICESNISRKRLGEIMYCINNSDFPYTVDVQVYKNIKNPHLIEHILRVAKPIYRKDKSSTEK